MNTTVSVTDGLRVVVVADDHLARAGLAALLADQIGCTVTGQVTTPAYVSAGPNAYVSDVAVWDLGWGPDTGADLLAKVAGERRADGGACARCVPRLRGVGRIGRVACCPATWMGQR